MRLCIKRVRLRDRDINGKIVFLMFLAVEVGKTTIWRQVYDYQ